MRSTQPKTPDELRECRICGKAKGQFDFPERESGRLRTECRACLTRLKREAGRRYELRHRQERREREQTELRREQKLKWNQLPENRAKRAAHYAANREVINAAHVERDRANPEARAARSARYHSAHPEASRRATAKRRARLALVEAETIDYAVVWERDGGICGICDEPADLQSWHLDHRVPLAQGGSHTYSNVQVTHPSCNISKGGGSSA
jgi:hypothetical protein